MTVLLLLIIAAFPELVVLPLALVAGLVLVAAIGVVLIRVPVILISTVYSLIRRAIRAWRDKRRIDPQGR